MFSGCSSLLHKTGLAQGELLNFPDLADPTQADLQLVPGVLAVLPPDPVLDGQQGPDYVHEARNTAQVRVEGREEVLDHTDVCGQHLPPG